MSRLKSADEIFTDMLDSLPSHFTIEEVLDQWPDDNARCLGSVKQAICQAKKLGLLVVESRRGQNFIYRKITKRPQFKRTEKHLKWDAFKKDNGI